MELDRVNNSIELETPAEYVVVVEGLKAGIRYYELRAEHKTVLDSPDLRLLDADAIRDLKHAYDSMPMILTQEMLPYSMPVNYAEIALKGIEWNRRQPASRKAKQAHRSIGGQLARLLHMTGEV